MIELLNVKKIYGDRTVLDIPKLSFFEGEAVALAGMNGSGKTTLLRIMANVLKPDSGSVTAPDNILYLPQKPYAFRGSVIENILIGAKAQKEKAQELLFKAGLSALSDKPAKSLSGGEWQKAALCRILIRPCKLLLLDEPTAALDAKGTELVSGILKEYKENTGCTLIFSTHSPSLALSAADRLILLRDGKTEADGKIRKDVDKPETEWENLFL
ncbi:MAG: ABC transporter ATP-binding protein [Clostridiales bacterium]|nr:ABC transporter ATP-binding protein [Clostridiales bacterium]